jgi:hypothetical protein
MRRDKQNIHIPKAVFCICTTMVTSIHEKRPRMLECNLEEQCSYTIRREFIITMITD